MIPALVSQPYLNTQTFSQAFLKRPDRKRRNGVITTLFKKGLTENGAMKTLPREAA